MDLKKYYKKISEIEQFASEHPEKYRLRLISIVLFGVISLIFLIVTGLILGILAIMKGAVGLAVVIVVIELPIIISLFARQKPDRKAAKLSKHKFPQLYQMINDISKELNGPKVNLIQINLDVNAGVYQSLFRRNFLLIGYPLTLSMSYDHFKAVLAHEVGHLSRNHSRTGNFIACVCQMWCYTASGGLLQLVFILPFAKLYVRLLERYSIVLMKQHEKDADSLSAQYSGMDTAAQALADVSVYSLLIRKKFREEIIAEIEKSHEPGTTFSICEFFDNMIGNHISKDELQAELRKQLNYAAMPFDPHPELKARLLAIGSALDISFDKSDHNAADILFAENRQYLIDKLNKLYRKEEKKNWGTAHNYYHECRSCITKLEEAARNEPLNQEQYIELVDAQKTINGTASGLEAAREAVELFPDSASLQIQLAGLMLEEDIQQGEEIIKSHRDAHPEKVFMIKEVVEDYFYRNGKFNELLDFMSFIDENKKLAVNNIRKAVSISDKDTFLPHGQSVETVREIISKLEKEKRIADAWLVKVDKSEQFGHPLFLLLLSVEALSFSLDSNERLERMNEVIEFPYALIIKTYYSKNKLAKKVISVDNSHIWPPEPRKSFLAKLIDKTRKER